MVQAINVHGRLIMLNPLLMHHQIAASSLSLQAPSTVALTHLDGMNGSSTFIDEVSGTWTSANSAALTTSTSRFGLACLNCNVTSTSHATKNLIVSAGGDYTIQMWANLNSPGSKIGNKVVFSFGPSYIVYLFNSPGSEQWRINFGGTTYLSANMTPATSPLDQFAFIQLTRETGITRCYINGVEIGTGTSLMNASLSSEAVFYLGRWSTLYWNGLIDEVRVCDEALPNVVPTSAFPNP